VEREGGAARRREDAGPAFRDLDPERAQQRQRAFQLERERCVCASFPWVSFRPADSRRPRRRERLGIPEDQPERPGGTTKEDEEWWATKTRTGGTYIPPARLAAMQKNVTDQSSKEYQRMTWEALKKSINGLINKVTNGERVCVSVVRVCVLWGGTQWVRGTGLVVIAR
jgi:hypothetical protein